MEEIPMKPLVLAVAVAVLATGCYGPGADPRGTLDMEWWFVRTTHDGTTRSYTCADAGVTSVTVSYSRGGSRSFSCRSGGRDGVVDTNAPAGTQRITITAYRGSVPLYRSSFDAAIPEGGTVLLDADVWGIPDELDLYARFLDATGTFEDWSTCGAANVTTLTWSLVDWAGTVVEAGSVPCLNPPGVSFRGAFAVDRDEYVIRMQGFAPGGLTFDSASTRFSCSAQSFNHHGPSIGNLGWDVFLYDITQNANLCP
jgi:hypothetical protein